MEDRRTPRRARLAVVAGVAALLVLAGCQEDGGSEPEQDPVASRPSAPAVATGRIDGPQLEPAWLVEATSADFASRNTSRRSFGYLTQSRAVYSGADTLLAVDRQTGETAWTADLDYRNEAACEFPEPVEPEPEFVLVVYGKNYCNRLAQVRLSDGEVIHTETLGGLGNNFSSCFQLEADWYCLRGDGIYRIPEGGDSEPVATVAELGGVRKSSFQDSIRRGSLSLDRSTMLIEVLHHRIGKDTGMSLIDVQLSDFSPRWQVSSEKELLYDMLPGGRFLRFLSEASASYRFQEIADGEGLETYSIDFKYHFDISSTVLDPDVFRLVDDSFVYGDGRAVHRVLAATGEPVWRTELSKMRLGDRSPGDFTVQTGPLSEDGSEVYATLQAEQSGAMELVRLRLSDGELTGRWAFPEEYAGSMNAAPYLARDGDGLLLVRNLSRSDTYGLEQREVDGPVYDLAWFTFPTEEEQ